MKEIKEVAEQYHDRLVMSMITMSGKNCDCCDKPEHTRICIEHDSQDYSKDMWICPDCYAKIVKYWKENHPKKIAPI